jgi:hypothetical protein
MAMLLYPNLRGQDKEPAQESCPAEHQDKQLQRPFSRSPALELSRLPTQTGCRVTEGPHLDPVLFISSMPSVAPIEAASRAT